MDQPIDPRHTVFENFVITAPRPISGSVLEEEKCLEIREVEEISLAAYLGLQPGDLLVAVEGHPAAVAGEFHGLHEGDSQHYVVQSARTGEQLEFRTRCVPLGMETGPTVAAFFDGCARDDADPCELFHWWEQGDWRLLGELCEAYLGLRNASLFRRMSIKLLSSPEHDTPALLLWGAQAYEQGKHKKGMAAIEEYEEDSLNKWTVNFHAIVNYYHAREALRTNPDQPGRARERARQAYEYCDTSRIRALYEKLGGTVTQPVRRSREFPRDYELPALDGGPGRCLSASLGELGPRQGLIVCCLGGYRGNGPYDSRLALVDAFLRAWPEVLGEVHVIVGSTERRYEWWFEAEDRARAAGRPVHVLYDPEGQVARYIGLEGSPELYLLDRTGAIVGEEVFRATPIWQALMALQGGGLGTRTNLES